jgi:methylenetetrahydrofolate reductase (NADPH)
MTNFSIEVTPRELTSVGTIADHLQPGTRVYITWLNGTNYRDTVRASKSLRDQGMLPVPHLAARAIQDETHLDTILCALRDDAGVKDILVIGGSLKRPVGAFDRTIQLLDTGLFAKYDIASIGVAGHPEGNPDIPDNDLSVAVQLKNGFAKSVSSRVHFTTQFCFEAGPIIDWERKVRQAGNQLDIHVGLAGLASLSTLIKHARNCGVGASIGVLTRRAGSLFKLSSATSPAKILLELAKSRVRDRESRIKRCHFFPFGSFAATAAWATALSTGDFDIADEDAEILMNTRAANN